MATRNSSKIAFLALSPSDWNTLQTFLSGSLGVFIGVIISILLGWF